MGDMAEYGHAMQAERKRLHAEWTRRGTHRRGPAPEGASGREVELDEGSAVTI